MDIVEKQRSGLTQTLNPHWSRSGLEGSLDELEPISITLLTKEGRHAMHLGTYLGDRPGGN
jgi:hypothetical protein